MFRDGQRLTTLLEVGARKVNFLISTIRQRSTLKQEPCSTKALTIGRGRTKKEGKPSSPAKELNN
jgi:hypothetical protein